MVPLKIRPPVPPSALRVLRDVPNIDAVIVDEAGRPTVAVEFKSQVAAPDARMLAARFESSRPPIVVVANETTEPARAILQEAGIGVVDGVGNAHLELPGLAIHVEKPTRRARARPAGMRISGKTAVVVQALLREPERDWKLTDLAKRAEVSVGTAHRVVRNLEDRELLVGEGRGPKRRRRVHDAGALLDLLAEELRDRGSRSFMAYRFEQVEQRLPSAVGRELVRQDIGYAISGVAAANILAPFLTTVPLVAIWISAEVPLASAAEAISGEATERGANLALMQLDDDTPLAFSSKRDHLWLANSFRIYVDAMRDPQRGAEQAEHFRREVIGF